MLGIGMLLMLLMRRGNRLQLMLLMRKVLSTAAVRRGAHSCIRCDTAHPRTRHDTTAGRRTRQCRQRRRAIETETRNVAAV